MSEKDGGFESRCWQVVAARPDAAGAAFSAAQRQRPVQPGPGTPALLRARSPLWAQLPPAPGGGSTAAPDRRLRARPPGGEGAPRVRWWRLPRPTGAITPVPSGTLSWVAAFPVSGR